MQESRRYATGREAMSEKYDFCYHGHRFKKEGIRVVRVSPWSAKIMYEKQSYEIPLSYADPLFRAFLVKTFAEESSSQKGKR